MMWVPGHREMVESEAADYWAKDAVSIRRMIYRPEIATPADIKYTQTPIRTLG